MSKNSSTNNQELIEGRHYDEPLIMPGSIDVEPERYVAEKPFDLTRYEYSILKKPYQADFWFNFVAGGTAGVVLSVIGKSISALIDKNNPNMELWEIITIVVGVLIALVLKKYMKSEDDKSKGKLIKVIDSHFTTNKPRHLHLTGREN